MSRLFLLFVVVPLVEIALLIRIGSAIGFWPTLAIVVGTAALGSSLARSEGLSAFSRFQEALAGKRPIARELIDGLIILASAVLLLTPGVLTDIVGLMGLFPATRPLIRKFVVNNFNVNVVTSSGGVGSTGGFNSENMHARAPRDTYEAPTSERPRRSTTSEGYETTMSGKAEQRPSYTRDTR